MPTEACQEEFEILTSIFLDEIITEELENGTSKCTIVLYPSTGDDEESKYVTLTLELVLPIEYPSVPPVIHFRNPRGLSETLLDGLFSRMKKCCEDQLQSPMIYDLIDMVKEFLTINNRPASECPICLISFSASDIFFRSQCFHHFHSYCLGQYLYSLTKIVLPDDNTPGVDPHPGRTCPVCRMVLEDDVDMDKLLNSPPPFDEEAAENGSADAMLQKWHCQQEELMTLFNKQKSQGGIIDPEENDRKGLLVITSPRGNADSDFPSSSSDGGIGGIDGDCPPGLVAAGQAPIPLLRVDPKIRAMQRKNKTVVERSLNSCQVKQQQQSAAKQPPQEKPPENDSTTAAATAEKNSSRGDTSESRHHQKRGKSDQHGNPRRQFK